MVYRTAKCTKCHHEWQCVDSPGNCDWCGAPGSVLESLPRISEPRLWEMLDPAHHETVKRWLDRGDGCAVYQNMALDSANMGHRQFVSFGSGQAQLEVDAPPKRLPDIGDRINWPYQLEGIVRRG